jgi:hypothetical protein
LRISALTDELLGAGFHDLQSCSAGDMLFTLPKGEGRGRKNGDNQD